MNYFIRNMNLDNLRPENVRQLIDVITSAPDHFNMEKYLYMGDDVRKKIHDVDEFQQACGTTACIAGYCKILQNGKIHQFPNLGAETFVEAMIEYLGLEPYDAQSIAVGGDSPWEDIVDSVHMRDPDKLKFFTADDAKTLLTAILDEHGKRA